MTLLAGFLRRIFIHRETLILENLALRQQLATYKCTLDRSPWAAGLEPATHGLGKEKGASGFRVG